MDFIFFTLIFLVTLILAVVGWKINPVFNITSGLLLFWLGVYGLVWDGDIVTYTYFFNETANTTVVVEHSIIPNESHWNLFIYAGFAFSGLAELAFALFPRKGGWNDDPLIGFRGRR